MPNDAITETFVQKQRMTPPCFDGLRWFTFQNRLFTLLHHFFLKNRNALLIDHHSSNRRLPGLFISAVKVCIQKHSPSPFFA